MTERLPFHFSVSCTGEGNGNPLQCSCLENPRDGGAWWPAIYGVAQSRTRLKRLSSSSSSRYADDTTLMAESEVAQSCPTLCNPMDCSPSGSSVHGIFQARVLKWGAIAFSNMSLQLCPTLCDPIDGRPPGSPVPGILQARTLEWVAISFSSA